MGSPSEVEDYPHLMEVKGIIRQQILQWISDAFPPGPPETTTEPPIAPGKI